MQLVHDYIVSLVNLYGIVHKEKVVEIYNSQNNPVIDESLIDRVMREDANVLAKDFVFIEGDYFVQESIVIFDDIDEVLAERAGKPFYVPRKNALLKYKDELYFEKTIYYVKFLRYVTKYLTDGNKREATDICEEIQFMCKDDFSMGEVFGLFDRLDIVLEGSEQMGEVLDLVTNLANNTRLWVNNGHTPNELFSIERDAATQRGAGELPNAGEEKVRKIGRNEPCPCGSGKKYKRCCLI